MTSRVYSFGPQLRADMADRLRGFRRWRLTQRMIDRDGLRPAAVTVAVVSGREGHACFVLTARAAAMRAHANQYALPGGRLDAAETATEAAIRELREEVGIVAGEADVLGVLDDYPTRSGYLITPVVVWAHGGGRLAANPNEVRAVHRVPLAQLDDPRSPRLVEIPESDAPVIQMRVRREWLHAPTAAVVYQFREVALHGRPTRVAHFEQPVWAWQ